MSPQEATDIEERIVQEAIRMSVEESSLPYAVVEPPAQTAAPAKPVSRFVKDVTFPDGTIVQPGTSFYKIWRVRNEGPTDWPLGCSLVTDGGDELCSPEAKVNVPPVEAGQETDIVVQLLAPQRNGRLVSYFRLQTADGVNFGHRVWANIRVLEDEANALDWQVVSGILKSEGSESASSTASLPSAVEVTSPPLNSTATAVASFVDVDDSALGSEEVTELANLAKVYEPELKVLRDMGFSDASVIVPLLKQHVPEAELKNSNRHPSADAMQRVVIQLLGQSLLR